MKEGSHLLPDMMAMCRGSEYCYGVGEGYCLQVHWGFPGGIWLVGLKNRMLD